MAGQGAMVAALALLAEAQVSMYYGVLWNASWWLYHGLLLAAFTVLITGWAVEAVRARSLVLFPRAVALRDELDQLNMAHPENLERLEDAMQEKDAYTRHHMGRVSEYGVAIAREMRLEPNAIKVVEIAGRIHDIGKIVVPDSVLMKPGSLTPQEYEQMKHHAARGEHIARSSKVLASVAAVVRAHHERYSGGGYPDGIAGDRIPVEARIIAVADTFDALTSRRVYRGARPVHEAVAELEQVAGTQLDPRCVAAYVAWLERSGWYRREAERAA
jgi:HD-GYP domain-containing protein (c-di-GMP phosphodiesterase class II)